MSERNLPVGVYPSGYRYNAIVRHKGKRHYLGAFQTVDEAERMVAAFRKENPKKESKKWKPGDVL